MDNERKCTRPSGHGGYNPEGIRVSRSQQRSPEEAHPAHEGICPFCFEKGRASIGRESAAPQTDPHVSIDESGFICFEWWNGDRKLCIEAVNVYQVDGAINPSICDVRDDKIDPAKSFGWLKSAAPQGSSDGELASLDAFKAMLDQFGKAQDSERYYAFRDALLASYEQALARTSPATSEPVIPAEFADTGMSLKRCIDTVLMTQSGEHCWVDRSFLQAVADQAEPVMPVAPSGDAALQRWGKAQEDAPLLLMRRDDGYWTPWHIAEAALQAARTEACRHCNGSGSMFVNDGEIEACDHCAAAPVAPSGAREDAQC